MLRYERDSMIPRSTPEFLLDYLDGRLTARMKILDVACGDGDLVGRLRKLSVHSVGVDISFTRALRASLNGWDVVRGDMVIASGILQQTTNPKEALKEWAETLTDDGLLVIMMSNIPAFKRKWLSSTGERWKLVGYRSQFRTIYTRSSFVGCIKDAGLSIEQLIDHPSSEKTDHWIAICRRG